MKNLFLLAFGVAALLSSCTQSELLNNETNEDRPMTFQAVVGKNSLTRTYGTNQTAYPTTSSFGTTAFFVQSGDWKNNRAEATTTTYIDKQEVKYYANEETPYTADTWHIAYAAYWPKQGSLTFFSYSPYSVKDKVTIGKESGVKVTDYDLTENKNVDLMVADIAADKNANTTTYAFNGVPTLFRHKLTQIGFVVKLYKDYSIKDGENLKAGHKVITLKSINISNIYNKGTYTQGADATNCVGTWTPDATLSSATYTFFSGNQELSTTDFAAPTDNDCQIYYLPQTFTEQSTAEIEVKYTIDTYTSEEEEKSTEEVTYTKLLKDIKEGDPGSICSWGINKKITYTITIGLDLIYFDPAVQEWEADSHSITI